jgi:hypothetical protein
VVGNRRVTTGIAVEPDLVAAGRLPVEIESEGLDSPEDVPVPETAERPRQPATIKG